jgi:anti-sigma factor RsiW
MNDGVGTIACARARELASAWIDGELADERELRSHVDRCAECSVFVERLYAMRAELAGVASVEWSDAWPRIAARASARSRSAARVPSRTWIARCAALFVGALGVRALQLAVEAAPSGGDADLSSSLAHLVSIEAPPTDLLRASATPERSLLIALAPSYEEHK